VIVQTIHFKKIAIADLVNLFDMPFFPGGFRLSMKYAGRFYFVSWHGRLLQAYRYGKVRASQEVENIGKDELWNVFVWEDGKLSLQNYRTNRWLSAEPSGTAICDRAQPDAWEKWTLHGVSGRVAFLGEHGRWLCARPPEGGKQYRGEVIADGVECKEWERFSMIPADGTLEGDNTWWNSAQSALVVAKAVVPIIVALGGYEP
jgi:hypothetical protein